MTADKSLLRSAPYFPVPNVEEAAKYYENALGFVREYSAGEPAQFAIYSRDGLGIMFRVVENPKLINPNTDQGGTWDVFFWVKDAQRLFDEFVSRGAHISYSPVVQTDYQMLEFAIKDNNGYVLGFGEPLKA